MAQQTQTRNIKVFVSTDGDKNLRGIAKQFGDLNKTVREGASSLNVFKNAFLAIQGFQIAGFGLGQFVEAIDGVQRLSDRLNSTEGNARAAASAFEGLVQVANSNFSSIEDTAQVYNRLSLSLRSLGLDQQAILGLTDTLQKSFRLFGATSSEVTGSIIQLSQGLASGQLRGQELRSVTEANTILAQALADKFGIAQGALLKFAEKRGGFTPVEVLDAIASATGRINEQAAKLSPTIGATLTQNFNKLSAELQKANQEFGITSTLVQGINFAFENINTVLIGVTAVTAYTAYTGAVKLAAAGTILFNNALAALAASRVTGILVGLGVAFAGLPAGILAAVSALGAATVAAAAYSEELGILENKTKVLTQSSTGSLDTVQGLSREYRALGVSVLEVAEAQEVFALSQNQATIGFDKTLEAFSKGSEEALVFSAEVLKAGDAVRAANSALNPFQRALQEQSRGLKSVGEEAFDFAAGLTRLNEEYLKSGNVRRYNAELQALKIAELNFRFKQGKVDLQEYNKELNEIQFGKAKSRANELRGELAELNAAFGENGNVVLYQQELEKIRIERVSKDFKEGRTNLLDLNKAISDNKLSELNRQFAAGAITLNQFNQAVEAEKLKLLSDQFRAGTISAREFNAEVTKTSETFQPGSALSTGISNYIEQAGTLSQNVANAITNTFGNLENFFTDFLTTGKANFRDFAQSVIRDLNQIITRSLIIRPLAQGILGAFSPDQGAISTAGSTDLATGSTANLAARGAVLDGRKAEFFAKGGVFDAPTAFSFGNKKMGVLGEAGPEAILPLSRNRNGELGVAAAPANVTVNVINQSGAQIEQRETTNATGDRFIEVVVLGAVKKGLSDGSFDRQFQQQYGLTRRGA